MRVGDKVYWQDDNPSAKLKGEVVRIDGDTYLISWENGRIIEYTNDMLITIGEIYGGYLKLDYQSNRSDILDILGI
jgi:hypothetical protein